jgi:hypothetical protein
MEFKSKTQREQFERISQDYMRRLQAIGIPADEINYIAKDAAGEHLFVMAGIAGKWHREADRHDCIAKSAQDREVAQYHRDKAREIRARLGEGK